MALDPRKRQKKLERKRAKERKTLLKERSRTESGGFAQASAAPIHECFRSAELWDLGIGWVVVSRRYSNGQIACAAFLVDTYCLGVKNVLHGVLSPSEYESRNFACLNRKGGAIRINPSDARRLLEDAVAYASGLGFSPHADFRRAVQIFGDIPPPPVPGSTRLEKTASRISFRGRTILWKNAA